MIKLVYVFRRLPHLSLGECHHYWRENHASLVRTRSAAIGLRRYVQVSRLDDPLNERLQAWSGDIEPYDGIADIYWKDYEDLLVSFSKPEAQLSDEELRADERRFIDTARSSLWLAREEVVKGGPEGIVARKGEPIIKLVHFFCRLPGSSLPECQTYWRETHGPLVQQQAAALGILRYVQAHTIDDPLNDAMRATRGTLEPYDGVNELWWNDRQELERSLSTPAGQWAWKKIHQDEQRFVDTARSSLWLAKEDVVIGDDDG
jgi:hypothetical protein